MGVIGERSGGSELSERSGRSGRVLEVRRWFGVELGKREAERAGAVACAADRVMPLIAGGRVVLVTGASGSGKSSLLGEVRRRLGRGCVDVGRVRLADRACVDCLGRAGTTAEVLGELGRLGLGEAWTYLLHPKEMSEGQRWRLRLAVGLRRARAVRRRGQRSEVGDRAGTVSGASLSAQTPAWEARGRCGVLLADEFGAVLDRVTAKVVARCLRRAVSGEGGVCAVVATSHEDLYEAVGADVVVRCDFGEVVVCCQSAVGSGQSAVGSRQ